MKDIHEVKDTQPCSFKHVRCRGVAAKAGSAYLIYSMNEKLGQNTPTTVPILDAHSPINLTDYQKPHLKSTNNATSTTQPEGTQWRQWHTPVMSSYLVLCIIIMLSCSHAWHHLGRHCALRNQSLCCWMPSAPDSLFCVSYNYYAYCHFKCVPCAICVSSVHLDCECQ